MEPISTNLFCGNFVVKNELFLFLPPRHDVVYGTYGSACLAQTMGESF